MDANAHHQTTFGRTSGPISISTRTSRPTPTKLSSINPFASDNGHHGQAVNTGIGKKTSPIARHESPINSSSSGSGSLLVNDCGVDANANVGRNAFEAYIEALVTQKVESNIEALVTQKVESIVQEMLRSGKISINDTTKETKSSKSPAFEAFTLNNDNKKNVYQPPAKRGICDWQEKIRNTPIKANNNISNQQQEQVAPPTNAIAPPAKANVPSPLSIEVKAYPRNVFDKVYERRPEKDWVEYAIKKCKYFDDLFDRLILFDIADDKYHVESTSIARNG